MSGGTIFTSLITKIRKLAGVVSLGDWQLLRALRVGVAAGVEHIPVLRQLECRTLVDIGASHGQFALVARHCFPEARIVSFEPLVGPAHRFRRVFAGDAQVTLHQVAIGSDAGEATIHVAGHDDSSSLLPITTLQASLFPGTAEQATEPVRVARLPEVLDAGQLEAPALLKIDVQGYELEVLKGCADLLDRFAVVYVECSFVELYAGQPLADEVVAFLQAGKFRLTGVYNLTSDRRGRAIQGDFLFRR